MPDVGQDEQSSALPEDHPMQTRGPFSGLADAPGGTRAARISLEEIGMRGRATFLAAGGQEFTLIPCLNDHPTWIVALAGMVAAAFTGCGRELETTGAS